MHVWTVTSIYNARDDIFVSVFENLSLATAYVTKQIKAELSLSPEADLWPEDYNWSVSKSQDTIEYSDEECDYILIIEKQEVLTSL